MPGLPLGAARQHDVRPELLDYEHIAGIEFIETLAGIPYPRSAAYRPVQGGAQMRVRPELVDAELSEDEARAYLAALVDAGLFAWRRVYRPAQGTFTLDGTNWRVEVTFAEQEGGARPRPFRVEGENVFPDTYNTVTELLMRLPQRLAGELDAGAGEAQESGAEPPDALQGA